jgi:hypothetical protein
MKAKQLLKMYANGRRDFRGENLKGLSLKNQDLSEVDFSNCDIRGTNFNGANLTGARFINAKAGLTKRWVVILLFACLVLALTAGFFALFIGAIVGLINDELYQIAGWLGLLTIIYFSWLSFDQGINIAIKNITQFEATPIIIALLIPVFIAIGRVFTIGVFGIGIFAVIITLPLAISFAVTISLATTLAYIAFRLVGALCIGIVILSIAVTRAIDGALSFANAEYSTLTIVVAVILVITILNFYLCFDLIKSNSKDKWVLIITVNFLALGTTDFKNANLTDADFTGAILKNANFEKAELIRTCFKDTKKLDLVCPGDTYLKNLQVQKLLQSGQIYEDIKDYG